MGWIGLIGGIVVIALVAIMVMRARSAGESNSIEDRLNELAALGKPVTLEELELSQPFVERVLMPMMEGASRLAQRFTPQQTLEAAQQKIDLAGMTHKLKPPQFFAIRIIAGVVGGVIGILGARFVTSIPTIQRLGLLVAGAGLGFYLPTAWLGSKIKQRQAEVLKALPDALDLLTICVEAGLGFDAAMSKVAEKWNNELSMAFARAVQEMQLGKLRREALRSMANSMDVGDVTSFVAAIIQADQLGVSMAKVMRIQSDTMRMKRRQRAEEKARQAPVKMMFPLVFFIFPTIMIILLGPAILQIKDLGSS
ncbi:MAG: type II secretion system F family protein [Anaerolineae bacterium]|nr:type II secretion system F family protein [Anaerolineae bacterium]